MSENNKLYEAPNMRIFQFTSNEGNNSQLRQSGAVSEPEPSGDYAARALNDLMGGTNTTIEK